MKECKALNFLIDVAYRNTLTCDLCKAMNWECPFDPNIDANQDPEGTICRQFLQKNLEEAIKKDFGLLDRDNKK